jgi:hypothetical protein
MTYVGTQEDCEGGGTRATQEKDAEKRKEAQDKVNVEEKGEVASFWQKLIQSDLQAA